MEISTSATRKQDSGAADTGRAQRSAKPRFRAAWGIDVGVVCSILVASGCGPSRPAPPPPGCYRITPFKAADAPDVIRHMRASGRRDHHIDLDREISIIICEPRRDMDTERVRYSIRMDVLEVERGGGGGGSGGCQFYPPASVDPYFACIQPPGARTVPHDQETALCAFVLRQDLPRVDASRDIREEVKELSWGVLVKLSPGD